MLSHSGGDVNPELGLYGLSLVLLIPVMSWAAAHGMAFPPVYWGGGFECVKTVPDMCVVTCLENYVDYFGVSLLKEQ